MIKNKQAIYFLDSISDFRKSERKEIVDLKNRQEIIKKNQIKPNSTLFSRGKRMKLFFTEDSKLYITPREYNLLKSGNKLNREIKQWDSLSARIINNYTYYHPSQKSFLFKQFLKRYAKISGSLAEKSVSLTEYFSPPKLWNTSIIGAILLGMFSMSIIYRYLGQEVSAEGVHNNIASGEKVISADLSKPQVLGEEKTKQNTKEIVENLEKLEKKELEKKIKKMVKGYPIEKMVPYIMKKDKTVIAFLIGIAKKESNWGKRVPVLNGQDCYNYWGYRGQRRLMGSGGHTCFNSRKDAVDAVAKRLDWLVNNRKLDTPSKMVVWKCGSSCAATGGQAAARKWISDVNFYFKKLNK